MRFGQKGNGRKKKNEITKEGCEQKVKIKLLLNMTVIRMIYTQMKQKDIKKKKIKL
jgi:hypothetical protein